MRARFFSLHLDAVGFFASLLCAVHCALLPFLLVLLSMFRLQFLLGHAAEFVLIACSSFLATASFIRSYRNHGRKHVGLLMLAGFAFIFYGLLAAPSEGTELALTSGGGLLVALGHYLSWAYQHRHKSRAGAGDSSSC